MYIYGDVSKDATLLRRGRGRPAAGYLYYPWDSDWKLRTTSLAEAMVPVTFTSNSK